MDAFQWCQKTVIQALQQVQEGFFAGKFIDSL
jgi:hypothetical protein